nr:DUF6133 family protein [Hungatella sp.]
MKNFMGNMKKKAENMGFKAFCKVHRAKEILAGNAGENYVDTGVKVLIAVVIGALLLGGLYALFGDVVMFSSRYNHDRNCYA